MTGSLQIKNGKFYMVLNTQKNGKRTLKWLPTGLPAKGNKRKAEQMLRETLLTYEVPKADILFADYITGQWLPYVRRKVDEVTYQGYELLAVRQVAPWFRERSTQLADVTLPLLQEYVDEKAVSGRKDGKGGLSPRSLRLHKNVLFQALTEAVKAGLLPANPCQYVVLPKTVRYESHFYTVEQLTRLFEAVRDEPLCPLLKITALYGLPHIRFHELRHSCASLLINAGFTLKDVQEWMGHADIKMTANIYGHLDVTRKQSMAAQLSGDLTARR